MTVASTRIIPFVKASACGNDFLIVEALHTPDLSAISAKMSDRRNGVGADGVEWLFPDADMDIYARLFNADGSEAEISGNGTRCVAAYLCSKHNKNELAIRTGAGVKTCKLTSRNGVQYVFQIAMGQPQIGSELLILTSSGSVSGTQVSMGNPHFVCIVKEFPLNWQLTASELTRDARFTHGINVEFVVIKDRSNIEVRFFERGVGQTQSSGTGSCAAAVAAIAARKVQYPVRVHAEGGIQTVDWNNEVLLEGAATLVCRGEFFG